MGRLVIMMMEVQKTNIVPGVEVKEDARPVQLPEHCHYVISINMTLSFKFIVNFPILCENLLAAGEKSEIFSTFEKQATPTQLNRHHRMKWVHACLSNFGINQTILKMSFSMSPPSSATLTPLHAKMKVNCTYLRQGGTRGGGLVQC